jgi:hypothetical protein
MAPQKIKAIKSLAAQGCGTYPQVEPALMAGLADRTEKVRFATVQAIYQSTDGRCDPCDPRRCCTPAIRDRLFQMAFGYDDHGCQLEASSRVRRVARLALENCGGPPPPPCPPQLPAEVVPEAVLREAFPEGPNVPAPTPAPAK